MKGIDCNQIREDVKERVKKNCQIMCNENTDDRILGALKRNNSLLMKLRNTLVGDGGLNAYDIESDGKNPEAAMWKARCERFRQVLNEWSPSYLYQFFEDGVISYNDFLYLEDGYEVKEQPEILMKKFNIPEKPVKTCIIYSPNRTRALEKLREISRQKAERGVCMLRSNLNPDGALNYAAFIDDEYWVVVISLHGFEGRKWHKCWIDERVSIGDFRTEIQPHAERGREDTYFLW